MNPTNFFSFSKLNFLEKKVKSSQKMSEVSKSIYRCRDHCGRIKYDGENEGIALHEAKFEFLI